MFQRRIIALAAIATAAVLAFGWPTTAQANLGGQDKQETKCGGTLGKSGEKLNKTYLKEVGKCRDSDISGKAIGACPTASNLAKIQKASDKLASSVEKHCGSTCSVSGLPCIGNQLCEPNVGGGFSAECTAGAKAKDFDLRDINFPGPLCPAFETPADWSSCVDALTQNTSAEIIDVVYGSISWASGITGDAQKCLSGLSKATQKLISTIYKGVAKCRSSNNKLLEDPQANGNLLINPNECRQVDAKLASKITKAQDKLTAAAAKCASDAAVLELDLCDAGVGGIADRASAAECLITAATELADSQDLPADRAYGADSLVEVTFPRAQGSCGDGIVNQISNNFAKLGEECDGADDTACPGNCGPPGDIWECTCLTEIDGVTPKYRHRYIADGFQADLDSGSSGTSHNSGVTDEAGYVLEIDPGSCDCTAMDDLECTGTSGDSVCNTSGTQQPFCSWAGLDGLGCDFHGTDASFTHNDADCYICDGFASNSGTFCTGDGDCSAQCYPLAGGAATGACVTQADCAAGEICRGQCDRSQTCEIVNNGAPLPISSGGTAVCVLSQFRTDATGTMDIVTGEQETNYQLYSIVHLGVTNEIPCPVCGGFCSDGPREGSRCTGTCSVSLTECRFDDDCPVSETCTNASPKCPDSTCNLSLVCRGGVSAGQPCRIEAPTTIFGLVSGDCQPEAAKNISGQGLEINFLPATSETVGLPDSLSCDSPGFELYDCPCPTDGGVATKPNRCAFACNAGPELGVGCGVNGAAINGEPTTCSAGANAGRGCDETSDCPGGDCTVNPTHCTAGDPGDEGKTCTTNGDCGGGGVCGDACPSGKCVPLCSGGLDGDAEEGFCSAGPPFYHCDGEEDTFRICSEGQEGEGCLATCHTSCEAGVGSGGSGSACIPGSSPCGGGETCCGSCAESALCAGGVDGILGTSDDVPGAGICVTDERNCFESIGGVSAVAQGQDKLDDPIYGPNNIVAVSAYCIGATSNSAINNTAALGGPGRLRQPARNETNGYASIP
jgi:hypothetical protein